MQNLKNLITALIEAVFGSKKVFIAQQSLPSVVYSQVDVPDTYQNQQMICPCDGWARLGTKTGDANTIVLNSSSVEATINLGVPGWLCQAVPIRKGSTIYYRITGASGELQFIRSIGGGLSSILQGGGGLCLLSHFYKHSLTRLRQSLLKNQKQNGLLISQFRKLTMLNILFQILNQLLHPLTELLAYLLMVAPRTQSSLGGSRLVRYMQQCTVAIPMVCSMFGSGCQLQKVVRLALVFQGVRQQHYGVIQQSEAGQSRLSFAQGGAL